MSPASKPFSPPFRLSPEAKLLRNEPLKPLTSLSVGGPAELLLLPAEVEDIRAGIEYANRENISWRVLGSGTNVLVPDEGLRGLTIKMWKQFSEIVIDGTMLSARAGALMWEASRLAAREGLSGLEWACGIPGTVGGAVFMNAGVKGAEVKDVLDSAVVLEPDGTIATRPPAGLELGYRTSALQRGGGVLLEATFALRRGDPEQITREMNRLLQERSSGQPLNQPNCGSVFRNPPGDYAGRLIEAAGCKGLRRGGVCVSELHANFIVNTGGGSAADVLALIEEIKRRVYYTSGVSLELEMRTLK